MKQIIIKCDKCGRDVSDGQHLIQFALGSRHIDLCTPCWIKFMKVVDSYLKEQGEDNE